MTSPIAVSLWIALAVVPTSPVQSQTDAAAIVHTRRLAAELMDSLKLPGLQIAIAVGDTVVIVENLGFADVSKKIPVSNSSLFRIGSVSKVITAVAALRLRQAGKLDLDRQIGEYLDGLPADKGVITALQIGGHLAGFGHYGRDNYFNSVHYNGVTESLDSILARPLLSYPGSKYVYSSHGYNVLGAVVERAAGKDFRAVVAEQVCKPLGMAATRPENSAHPPGERVHLYGRDSTGKLIDASAIDLSDRWPSGGYLSTAEDIARLGSGMMDPKFLGPAGRDQLLTTQRLTDGKETKVGFGLRIAADSLGRRYLHHGGETPGGRAFFLLYPDQGVAVAILSNLTFAPLGEKEALKFAGPYLSRE